MLEGFDPDWIDAAGRRFTYYANLSPGTTVSASSPASQTAPGTKPAPLIPFYLKPPFYRTSAFARCRSAFRRLRSAGCFTGCACADSSEILRGRSPNATASPATSTTRSRKISPESRCSWTRSICICPTCRATLRERLDEACNLTRYSLAEARRAISDLRSDELEGPELAAALPEIANRVWQRRFRPASRSTGRPAKLNPATESNLLRIFQEALTNAVKHAHATTVDVELKFAPAHDRPARPRRRPRVRSRKPEPGRQRPLRPHRHARAGRENRRPSDPQHAARRRNRVDWSKSPSKSP